MAVLKQYSTFRASPFEFDLTAEASDVVVRYPPSHDILRWPRTEPEQVEKHDEEPLISAPERSDQNASLADAMDLAIPAYQATEQLCRAGGLATQR